MKVLIAGAGIIGLSIARELSRAGIRDIKVIDKSRAGQESSWAAAGMLAPNAETEKTDFFFRFCIESNRMYDDFAASLLNDTGIDPGLDSAGMLQLAFSPEQAERINEKSARQRQTGISTKLLSPAEILDLEPDISPHVSAGVFYPEDRQIDNRKLVSALIEFCRQNNIEIMENCRCLSVETTNGRVSHLDCASGVFSADIIILATGAWTSLIELDGRQISVSVRPIRGQMLALRGRNNVLQKVIYGPDCYLVPRSDGRILVGASVEDAGFEKAVIEDVVKELHAAAARILPPAGQMDVMERWCGLRPFAADGLPVIGQVPGVEDLIVATAHFRNGILLAPITAKIVAEKIVHNRDSKYLDIFRPGRFAENATAGHV